MTARYRISGDAVHASAAPERPYGESARRIAHASLPLQAAPVHTRGSVPPVRRPIRGIVGGRRGRARVPRCPPACLSGWKPWLRRGDSPRPGERAPGRSGLLEPL